MEANKHGHIWREKDITRMISQYGNKPSADTKKRLEAQLEKKREVFKQVERYRSRSVDRTRGLGR